MPKFLTKIVELFNKKPNINKMGFLSSFFKVDDESFTDADEFEYDVVRSGEQVAPAIQDLSTGAVYLVEDKYKNKKVPFPVYSLASPVGIGDLMKRQPGENAYEQKATWFGKLAKILVARFSKMTKMLRYAIELQASEVLQTGKITLTDEKGKAIQTLDLKPKASHFPTTAVPWGTTGSDVMSDISALADVIREDGYCDVTNLIFGKKAWGHFIADEKVKESLRNDGLNLGALNPALKNKGAKYLGYIDIGADRFDLWLYNAGYEEYAGGKRKKFMDENKIIFLPDFDVLDFRKMFGGIPTITKDRVFSQLFDGKIKISNEYDFRPRVFLDEGKECYVSEIKSRPLCWPYSIDTFGCLTIA